MRSQLVSDPDAKEKPSVGFLVSVRKRSYLCGNVVILFYDTGKRNIKILQSSFRKRFFVIRRYGSLSKQKNHSHSLSALLGCLDNKTFKVVDILSNRKAT